MCRSNILINLDSNILFNKNLEDFLDFIKVEKIKTKAKNCHNFKEWQNEYLTIRKKKRN